MICRLRNLFAVWVCCLASAVAGLRIDVQASTSEAIMVLVLYKIGLDPGAALEVDLHVTADTNSTLDVAMVLLTEQQWSAWLECVYRGIWGSGTSLWIADYDPVADTELFSSYFSSTWRVPLLNQTVQASTPIRGPKRDFYYLGIVNPRWRERRKLSLSGHVHFHNPGSAQELPTQALGMPKVLRIEILAFVLLLVPMCWDLLVEFTWRRRRHPAADDLQWVKAMMVACVCARIVWLAMRWFHWELLALLGVAPPAEQWIHQCFGVFLGMWERLVLLTLAWSWRLVKLSELVRWIMGFLLISWTTLALFDLLLKGGGASGEPLFVMICSGIISMLFVLVIFLSTGCNLFELMRDMAQAHPETHMWWCNFYRRWSCFVWIRRVFVVILFEPLAVYGVQQYVFATEDGVPDWTVAELLQGISQWLIYGAFFLIFRIDGFDDKKFEDFLLLIEGGHTCRQRQGTSSPPRNGVPSWASSTEADERSGYSPLSGG